MMRRIDFRVPPELLAEAERLAAAAGISVGLWTRKLVERETGITVDVRLGIAGSDERTRKRVQRLGVKAIKARAKEQTNGK
jgi:hypothetical protein